MTGNATRPSPSSRAAEALKTHSGKSLRKIAKLAGVNVATVWAAKRVQNDARPSFQTNKRVITAQKRRAQANSELAAWIIKHASKDQLPMILTWMRSIKNKTVIATIKNHMEDRRG